MRLVCGAGLDALHLLGLDDIVSNAEEDKEGRHQGSGAATASPQHRDHGSCSGRFMAMARAIRGWLWESGDIPSKMIATQVCRQVVMFSVFDDIYFIEKDEGTDGTPSLLIPLPCPAMLLPLPPSLVLVSLLLGWAEAFVSPAVGGIFSLRSRGDTAPPPPRRPSSFLSWRSPGVCVGERGLPRCSPRYVLANGDSSRRRERRGVVLRSKQNDDPADTSTSGKNYTQIEDGSPLGVAIVVLGGAWLAFADGQDMPLPFGMMDGVGGSYSGSVDDGALIWSVFATASVAAGISRLVRYYSDKNDK